MCLKEPVLLATAAKMRLFQPVVIEKQNKNESHLGVFPSLAPLARFLALGASGMFFFAGHQVHVFSSLAPAFSSPEPAGAPRRLRGPDGM